MASLTKLSEDSPVRALWPTPAEVRSTWVPRPAATDYLAVPTSAAPRLLVPIGAPGADRLLFRFGGSRRVRAARKMLGFAARTGALRWLPVPRLRVTQDPVGIEAHLEGVFDQPVRIGVMLGPPRANLKPVLQVFAASGEVLGFAKVGPTPTTEALLATEATTLRWLAQHPVPGLAAPRVIDYDTWRAVPILVQSPLSMAQSGRSPTSLPADQLAGLAVSGGVSSSPLEGSPFWTRVREVGDARWHDLDASAFRRLRDTIDTHTEVSLGAWHGDFGPWNAAAGPERLEVWDWERFEDDVPIGLDGAHYRVQVELMRGADPTECWTAMKADVAEIVKRADVLADVPVTAACYILAIWRRYRMVTSDAETPALRKRVTWLCGLADVASASLSVAPR